MGARALEQKVRPQPRTVYSEFFYYSEKTARPKLCSSDAPFRSARIPVRALSRRNAVKMHK